MLAASYFDDEERSKAMGIALGGMALGVLFGYPVGGFMYDSLGKGAPFYLVMAFSILMAIFQVILMRNSDSTTVCENMICVL